MSWSVTPTALLGAPSPLPVCQASCSPRSPVHLSQVPVAIAAQPQSCGCWCEMTQGTRFTYNRGGSECSAAQFPLECGCQADDTCVSGTPWCP